MKTPKLFDLFEIHHERIINNELSTHPKYWLMSFDSFERYSWLVNEIPIDNIRRYIRIGGKVAKDQKELVEAVKNIPRKKFNYYIVDKNVALKYQEHTLLKRDIEGSIQYKLELLLGYEIEVLTDVGKIDCLSDSEIMEIKEFKYWKHGLGQLLSYSYFHPSHKKILFLFSLDNKPKDIEMVRKICSQFNVEVQLEIVDTANNYTLHSVNFNSLKIFYKNRVLNPIECDGALKPLQ